MYGHDGGEVITPSFPHYCFVVMKKVGGSH